MPRWTKEDYDAYQNRREASGAKPEQAARAEPMGEVSGEKAMPSRVIVRITSFRRKLLDPDNLIGGSKYFIDGLRHAALIPDDRPQDIELEVRQEKVTSKSQENTTISIFSIDTQPACV